MTVRARFVALTIPADTATSRLKTSVNSPTGPSQTFMRLATKKEIPSLSVPPNPLSISHSDYFWDMRVL